MAVKATALFNAMKESGYHLESANASDFYTRLKDNPAKAAELYTTLKADKDFHLESTSADDFISRLGLKKKDGTLSSTTGNPIDSSGVKAKATSTSASGASDPMEVEVEVDTTQAQPAPVTQQPNPKIPTATSIPIVDDRYLRRNPFFNTTMDRPDLVSQRAQAKVQKQSEEQDQAKLITGFIKSPTPDKVENDNKKDVADVIKETKTVDLQLAGKYNADEEQKLEQDRSQFSSRFYDGGITADDIDVLRSANPIAMPQEISQLPSHTLAEGINNKTKILNEYSRAVNKNGADKYAIERESLDDLVKTNQDKIDEYTGSNYIYKEGDVFKTALPEKQFMADEANARQKEINDASLKKSFLERDFKVNVYEPHVKDLMLNNLLPDIGKQYLGLSAEDIYKYENGLQMAAGDTPSEKMLSVLKAVHAGAKVDGIIKYDETNHLTKESVIALRNKVTELVNKLDDPIINAYEHGTRNRSVTDQNYTVGGELSPDGSTATTRKLPIDPEDMIRRTINYFNYDVPAQVLAESYTNKFKKTEDGQKVAAFMENQSKVSNLFSSDKMKQYEAGIKATLDSNYIILNNKYDKLFTANPVFNEIRSKWQEKVNANLVTPELAYTEAMNEASNNPSLKVLFDGRQKEVDHLRDAANKQREKYIISGLSDVNSNLTIDDEGRLAIKGMTHEQVQDIISKYQQGYNKEISSSYQGQDEALRAHADALNSQLKKQFGGLASSFMVGVTGAIDDLGAATSRWIYHKTGKAGDAMNYFEGEKQRPLNIGDYADEHFRFKGLASLLDPAYYGFAAGQSFPYAAPAIVAGVATGGTTAGIIASAMLGATLETTENALNTRNDLYMNGTHPSGVKVTSQEADRAGADNFKKELLPNIVLQSLELGTLLRASKYVKPSMGLSGIAKGTGDVLKSGLYEATQEGIQGLIQYNAAQRATGAKELDMFDYMQTDDFAQNFFGGFAGGLSMGGAVKPMAYFKSVQSWKGMLNDSRKAFAESMVNGFAEGVPFASALHAEMNGSGAEYRDGIRLRIDNKQYENGAEKENLGRVLKYSDRLSEAVKREGVVPSNINGLYIAHNSAMADLHESLAKAAEDAGLSSNASMNKAKARDFQAEATKASNGDAQVYYAIDHDGRPVFMSQKTANVLGENTLTSWKRKGYIQQVSAINDDQFNTDIASKVNAASAVAPVTETVEQPQETISQLLEKNKERIPDIYHPLIESRPEEIMRFVSQQARNVTADEQPYVSASEDVNQPSRIDAMKIAREKFGDQLVDKAIEMFPGQQQGNTTKTEDKVTLPTVGQEYQSTNEGVEPATVHSLEGEKINLFFKSDNSYAQVTPDEFNLLYGEKQTDQTNQEGTQPVATEEGGATEGVPNPAGEQTKEGEKPVGNTASNFFRGLRIPESNKDGGITLYSNPVFIIPKTIWNGTMSTIATAIDAGVAIADAIQRGIDYIKENHSKDVDETAVRHVLEGYVKSLDEKPVRESKESMADYATRVLSWRKKMLTTGTPAQQNQALASSQTEVDFVKKVNDGIEALRGNINLGQKEFNKAMSLPQNSSEVYVAALKYLKSTNKDAANILRAIRKENPTMIAATEISLLKKQLMDYGRGFRAGVKDAVSKIAAIRAEISSMLKEYNDEGLFSGVTYTPKELLRMASYVNNAVTETTLNHFRSMLTKLIEKAEFGRKVNQAKLLQKQLRKILKSKETITSNDISLLKELLTLNPLRVQDIDKFNDVMNDIAVTRTAKESVRIYTNDTVQKFVEEERVFDVKERAREVIEKFFELMDSSAVKELDRSGKITRMPSDVEFQQYVDGIANPAAAKAYKEQVRELIRLSEILSTIDRDAQDKMSSVDSGTVTMNDVTALDYASAVESVDNKSDSNDKANNRLVLEEMAKAQQQAIDPDDSEFTDEQKDVLGKLKKLDVTGFDSNSLRLFINVLNNVVLNDDMSGSGIFEVKAEARTKVVKEFTDWLDSKEYKVRQKDAKGTIGKTVSDLKKAFTSTEQIIWHIANNAASLAAKIYETSRIGAIKQGYVKTVQEYTAKVVDKLNALFGEGLVQDASTNIKMTIHSWLSQNKYGSEQENQQEFSRRISEIKRDIAIKEEFGKENDKKEAALVREVFKELQAAIADKKGVDINGDKFEGLDAAVMKEISWLDEPQQKAYDLFREVYDDTRPMFEEVMEKYLNKEFIPWQNYMPDSFRKLFGGLIDTDITDENFGQSVFARESENLADADGAFNVRVEGNRLVEPKPSEDTRVINYNWFDRNTNNSRAMIFDIHTLKERQIASEVFKSKRMEDEVGRDNMEMLKESLLKEIKGMTGMQGKPSARYLRAFKAVTNTLGSIAAKFQLVSVAAYFKQAWSAYANTAAYLGKDAGYMPRSIALLDSNEDVKNLVKENEISLRGTTKAGTNIFGEKNVADVEQTQSGNNLVKSMQKVADKVSGKNNLTGEEKSMMRVFLEHGDVVSAKASWVALYGQWLVKNGVYASFSDIDWAKESTATHPEASAYAQLVTSKQLNVNSRNAFGQVYQDSNAAISVLKGMFGLFGNFGFNKTIAIWNNISTLRSDGSVVNDDQRSEEKEFAARSLASGLAEEMVFQFIKGVAVKLTIAPLVIGLGKIFGGDDEDKILSDMKDKIVGNAFKGYLSNVISNYFFSFAGTGQQAMNEKMNDLLHMVGVKDNFFFETKDNPNYTGNTGLFAASGVKSLWDDAARLSKLFFDRKDRFGGKVDVPKGREYRLATLATISDLAQMFKLNDADVNRLIQKRMKILDLELDKRYKEPYWRDVAEDAAMRPNLSVGGRKRDLTTPQQQYYYQQRQDRILQLKDSNMPDDKKMQIASEYAKQKLVQKFGMTSLKLAPPKEP